MRTFILLLQLSLLLSACSDNKGIKVERVTTKPTIVYDSIESRMPVLRIAANTKDNTVYTIVVNPDFMIVKYAPEEAFDNLGNKD